MDRSKFLLFGLLILGIIGYSCEKEPVDSKLFVERYLIGRWYVNTYVELEVTNNNKDTTRRDTIYQVISSDTSRIWVRYTEDKKFIRGTDTVAFSIDDKGLNINYKTTPDSTWNMPYVRTNYFKTVFTRTETVGTDIKKYIIEQELKKQ